MKNKISYKMQKDHKSNECSFLRVITGEVSDLYKIKLTAFQCDAKCMYA